MKRLFLAGVSRPCEGGYLVSLEVAPSDEWKGVLTSAWRSSRPAAMSEARSILADALALPVKGEG